MSEGAGLFASGPCFVCGSVFFFNPGLVPSIFVDPETRRPPDLDENHRVIEPSRESLERARRCPICRECVEFGNALRAKTGREPIPILPGAYGLSETL